jgi:hypothetical protein
LTNSTYNPLKSVEKKIDALVKIVFVPAPDFGLLVIRRNGGRKSRRGLSMASIPGGQFAFMAANNPVNVVLTPDGNSLPPPVLGSFNLELVRRYRNTEPMDQAARSIW